MPDVRVAGSELILGGPGNGPVARAAELATAWLAMSGEHEAIYVATAQAWDAAMRHRIAHLQRNAVEGAARLRTVEEPLALAHALGKHSRSDTLVVVDALTLWLTALMMRTAQEHPGAESLHAGDASAGEGENLRDALPLWRRIGEGTFPAALSDAIAACAGPLVLIGHAISPSDGVPGRDARQFADTLDRLDRQAAAACERVTLVSNGLAMILKGAA